MPEEVALRKESVDRNLDAVQIIIVVVQSLSARRAWIEISLMQCQAKKYSGVALRKESVDRNKRADVSYSTIVSRSPQGERG